ncbi:MAG TPA: hypothetical protein VMU51_14230 [Mycobacteriales bacterium]|nr:hypothetical protein [Mycobacteriales bacterium]
MNPLPSGLLGWPAYAAAEVDVPRRGEKQWTLADGTSLLPDGPPSPT